jgi:hypothetical protein
MVGTKEGTLPYFHEAFTQLHLGQLLASFKCFGMDRRDGGINPNADYILRRTLSRPRVDEDLGNVCIARLKHDTGWREFAGHLGDTTAMVKYGEMRTFGPKRTTGFDTPGGLQTLHRFFVNFHRSSI